MTILTMKIRIIGNSLKSPGITILPFETNDDSDVHFIQKSHPILASLTSISGGKIILKDSHGHQAFLLVEVKSENGLEGWLEFFMSHGKDLIEGAQLDLSNPKYGSELGDVVQAFSLAHYQVAKYTGKLVKTELLKSAKSLSILVGKGEAAVAKKILVERTTLATYQMEVMDLVNGPGNRVNAPFFNRWVRKMSRKCGFKVKILNKKQIQEQGLEALLSVNRGSEWDPSFIIAQYHGSKNPRSKTLGLVGKGVTFDTGGLSIKPSNNLHYMKSDMGGAAAVLGTIAAVSAMQWPINIIAITPITDNCVDANAIKPGDVINSYSGKTIEVINTDAEGRLILADALSYLIKNFEVDHVIDLATLTGSSVRTFGPACAALFCNDDELEEQLFLSGLSVKEKVWSLPLWDEYDDEMKSDVADIKNLSTRPMAGAITAAKFLQFFTHNHPSWAHLDIAGTAFGDTKFAKGKAATGYGVHLLCHYIQEYLI